MQSLDVLEAIRSSLRCGVQALMLTVVTQLAANTAAAVDVVPAEFGPGASLGAETSRQGLALAHFTVDVCLFRFKHKVLCCHSS